jgi:hypothetical protein
MNNQPHTLHPAVLAASQKLDEVKSPDKLTLEEVMMCFHRLPCRRVTPGSDWRLRKYCEGSVLVYKHEVVLMLNPEGNNLNLPCDHSRFVGPKRQYKGVLPGSRIYTKGQVLVYVLEAFAPVSDMRKVLSDTAEHGRENPGGGLFAPSEGGQLNDHRCPEAFGLLGRIDAKRFIEANLGEI